VQDRFHLWDQRLKLLNGTSIPYRQLRIPCCSTCNNETLGTLEKKVQQAMDEGPKAVEALDRLDLYLWLGKIFYGLLYREHFLPLDRRQSHLGPIIARDQLKRYDMHYVFLQAILSPIEFRDFFPASIFVFETQMPKERQQQFDLVDNELSLAVALRIGRVGVLATLQDGGAQGLYAEQLAEYRPLLMHPLQWRELVAMYFYRSTLLNRVPHYMVVEQDTRMTVVQAPLEGLSAKPIYDGWDVGKYARILAAYVNCPLEEIYAPPRVMSWLRNPDGTLRHIDLAGTPLW